MENVIEIPAGDTVHRARETTCMSISVGLHALLLLWNPILLKTDWQPAHDFVTVDVVDQPAPGAPVQEAPAHMSLMNTLKDMLTRSNPSEIAHVAPQTPPTPQVAAPAQPKLQDRIMHPFSTTFTPKSNMEDLANTSNPSQINTAPHPVNAVPVAGPTLSSKSFQGIRAKDLPFNVNESINANETAVPIAVGHSSLKATSGYTGPQLSEKGTSHSTLPSLHNLGGTPMDTPSLGAGASATIPLQGTGRTGNAPTGAPTGQVLQNRSGNTGGLVNRALMGGRGSSAGTGLEGIPSAAKQLDENVEQDNSASKHAKTRSGDISGPLSNRAIIHKVIPQYPQWAEEQGIMGSVQIYFTVDAAGNVRSNIQVKKTTGNVQLDQLAVEALKQLKFAASAAEGEWGVIASKFSLSS